MNIIIDDERKLTSKNTCLRVFFSIFFWASGKAAGLLRSIFLGAVKRIVPNEHPPRAQKGYSRISLSRFASFQDSAIRRSQPFSSSVVPARRKLGAMLTMEKLLAKIPASQRLSLAYYRKRMLIPSYKIIPISDALRYDLHGSQ